MAVISINTNENGRLDSNSAVIPERGIVAIFDGCSLAIQELGRLSGCIEAITVRLVSHGIPSALAIDFKVVIVDPVFGQGSSYSWDNKGEGKTNETFHEVWSSFTCRLEGEQGKDKTRDYVKAQILDHVKRALSFRVRYLQSRVDHLQGLLEEAFPKK